MNLSNDIAQGLLSDAQVAITDTETGYRVEAAVPVRELVDDFIWPGRILQGDAGIMVADKAASTTKYGASL